MGTLTMIYHPKGGGTKYTSEGVEYYAKAIDSDEMDTWLKKGWFKHFSEFDKPRIARPKTVKKTVKKTAKKKAKK